MRALEYPRLYMYENIRVSFLSIECTDELVTCTMIVLKIVSYKIFMLNRYVYLDGKFMFALFNYRF